MEFYKMVEIDGLKLPRAIAGWQRGYTEEGAANYRRIEEEFRKVPRPRSLIAVSGE